MTRTELMLLMQTDGRPTLNLEEVAKLLNMTRPSLLNRVYAKTTPFPMFQLEGSSEWQAHVTDVAAHIDKQRAAAAEDLANFGGGDGSLRVSDAGDRPQARGGRRQRAAHKDKS